MSGKTFGLLTAVVSGLAMKQCFRYQLQQWQPHWQQHCDHCLHGCTIILMERQTGKQSEHIRPFAVA